MDKIYKIDLHAHSVFSDGTSTPQEIVDMAINQGLDLIALTDHNTISGCKSFSDYAAKKGAAALCGIEISTTYLAKEIHLLGYFAPNTDFSLSEFKELTDFFDRYQVNKKNQLTKIIENLAQDFNNLSVSDFFAFVSTLKKNNNLNRVHIANYLQEKGIVSSVKEAFDNYLYEGSKYYVENEVINLFDAIKLIEKYNGVPVIAHPMQYKLEHSQLEEMFSKAISSCQVLGIEAFHYECSKKDSLYLLTLANTIIGSIPGKKVIFTMGSDYHGQNKENTFGKPYSYELDDLISSAHKKYLQETVEFINNKFNLNI